MKLLAINGSPRPDGNTAFLLRTVMGEVARSGVETELFQLGSTPVSGCRACMQCRTRRDSRCVIDDRVGEAIARMIEADAIVIGSPTYFAGVTPETKALIDRSGYVALANDRLFARKIGAAVTVHRRGGAVCAFDTITRFLLITGMVVPGSTYWNFAAARNPGEAAKDEEAIRNMIDLGSNLAWLLRKLRG